MQSLEPGIVFADDFRVVRSLAHGGMGAVYIAEQLSTAKRRALKVMLPELVSQPSLRKRFELEAKIGARIDSDHVVEVIAAGVDSATGTPWIAMELLDGSDLATHVDARGPVTTEELREVFSQLCHALGRAHVQDIVHRDLKPENIFLAKPRRSGAPFVVKILDFGIARLAAEAKTTSSRTQAGLGTPLWMAPEQSKPGYPVTPRADVWALGLIAFWALTGRFFWKSAYDPASSLMMLGMEAFVHPTPTASARAAEYGCAERLPRGFDRWFARCVVQDQMRRYPDAGAAHAALDSLLAHVVSHGPPAFAETVPAPTFAPHAQDLMPASSATEVLPSPSSTLPMPLKAAPTHSVGALQRFLRAGLATRIGLPLGVAVGIVAIVSALRPGTIPASQDGAGATTVGSSLAPVPTSESEPSAATGNPSAPANAEAAPSDPPVDMPSAAPRTSQPGKTANPTAASTNRKTTATPATTSTAKVKCKNKYGVGCGSPGASSKKTPNGSPYVPKVTIPGF